MSNGVPTGTRTTLSRYNFRRIYQRAIDWAGDDLVERDLHGPHDPRHTFSTWLEDAGIPGQVIDELMGHERSRHAQVDARSRVGARYRHTTPEMAIRVMTAIDEPLAVVLRVAETDPAAHRVFQVREGAGRAGRPLTASRGGPGRPHRRR